MESPVLHPPRASASLLLAAAGLGFIGGLVGAGVVRTDAPRRPPLATPRAGTAPARVPAAASGDPVVDVVAAASPAVVSVIVSKDLPKLEDVIVDPFGDPFGGSSPFGFRFRRPSGDTERREVGGGTGFVVDAGGLILTNRHVVADERADYTVLLNSGEKVEARVLARDPVLDLAVLKIDRNGLPAIPLGDSSALRVGQAAVAIGNALGEFRNTVSVGVISGLGRNIAAGDGSGVTEVLDAVIQTDAAINPGNSGGPLLNLAGEAVGINTAIAGGAENIGFAIPSDEARRVVEDVRTTGRILRPFLGVRYVLLTPALAKANDLPVDHGALVVSGGVPGETAVEPGGAADRAGIREGDILLEFDGQRIDAEHTLAARIRQKRPGDRVSVRVLSGGEEKTVEVTLGEAK